MAKIARTYWVEEREGDAKVIRKSKKEHAILIGSLTKGGLHAPLFDLDLKVSVWRQFVKFETQVDPSKWTAVVRRFVRYGLIGAASFRASGIDPTLLFDVPFKVRRSSTPGHFHLFVEHELSWSQYRDLLGAMCRVGLVEQKYLDLCVRHKMGMLIKPSLTKKSAAVRRTICYDDIGY